MSALQANPFLFAGGGDDTFAIERSLRFNSGDSSYLNFTPSAAGNRKTWTWSGWVKRSALGSATTLFSADVSASSDYLVIRFESDTIRVDCEGDGQGRVQVTTSAVYRDPSAWYHIVVALDTTQGTAADRCKIYVNSVLQTTSNTLSQNKSFAINATVGHEIGRRTDGNDHYFDGNLAEVNFIDGQALAPTDFGEFDANGVWQAKEFTGTYSSGTRVYSSEVTGASYSGYSPANAFDGSTSSNAVAADGSTQTFSPSPAIPVSSSLRVFVNKNGSGGTFTVNGVSYASNTTEPGSWVTISGVSSLTSVVWGTSGFNMQQVAAIEVDGTILTDPTGLNSFRLPFTDNSSTGALGYDAAVTAPTLNPKGGMDVVTYTGTGSTRSISSLAFQPDFVWIKCRSVAHSHHVFDSVRGATKHLFTNNTLGDVTSTNFLTSFDSNGFSLGTDNSVNQNSSTFVAWCWKAGGAAVSNTDGSLNSQVSANNDYGFSIVSYTGGRSSAGNNTVGHGLSSAPKLVITKSRASNSDWVIQSPLLSANKVLFFKNWAEYDISSGGSLSDPTSSVFSTNYFTGLDTSGDSLIAYCWSEVAGFSKFGSYTGNGSATGPTVTTGFKVKYLLLKSVDSTASWYIFDSSRDTDNPRQNFLRADASSAETTDSDVVVDLNDTGFQIKSSGGQVNQNNETFIYAAFADRPGNNWTPNNLSADDGVTTVAQASGGTPIQVTTDTFGKTLGSGINSDSNASSLSLCMPLTSQGSLSIMDDVSPTGRTVSAKTIANSNAAANATYYQYYGGSTAFNGSTSKLTTTADSDFIFGTGDFTVEAWFYQTSDNTYPTFFEIGSHLGTSGIIFLTRSSGQAKIYSGAFYGTATFALNQWNHVAWVRASGVLNIYVNGALGSSDAFTNDLTSTAGNVTFGTTHSTSTGGYMFPGYMQDIRVYKGVAKYTSAFTVPGRNESVAAGNDSLVDSPSNGTQADTGIGGEVVGNYATLNPLSAGSRVTLSNGNLELASTAASGQAATMEALATFTATSGKFYAEVTNVSNRKIALGSQEYGGDQADVASTGEVNNTLGGTASGSGASFSTSDIIGIAVDFTNKNVYFYKNNTLIYSVTGYTSTKILYISDRAKASASAGTSIWNFGQRAFAYTAPSGYKSLNTANLPTPTIADGSKYFDTKIWDGNDSASRAITGLNMSPDMLWFKKRNNTYDHFIFDAVRGDNEQLIPNSTNAESTTTTRLKSFDSNGFTIGDSGGVNDSGNTYVAWAWDAGTSTVTNNDGSIASQVRANPTAGFSIVSYTGTGVAGTIGHSLNAQPSMVVIKDRSAANAWAVQHVGTTLGSGLLKLNATDAVATSVAGPVWNSTAPTSSVLSVGTSTDTNGNGNDYIAYCFAPVEGYSAMGSYTGNGSTDGPFVHTGFKIAFLLLKCTNTTELWMLHDSARDTDNVVSKLLQPHTSDAEIDSVTNYGVDFLSNGFKFRSSSSRNNGSGNTYIYIAFASNPFQANGGLAR